MAAQETNWLAFVILALALLGAAYMIKPVPGSIIVNNGDSAVQAKTLDSTGTFSIKSAPDKAEFYMGVETTARDVQDSQQQNAEKMNAVIAALEAKGLPKDAIETSSYSVYPKQQWNKTSEQYETVGYTTTNTLYIKTTSLDKVGSYIDAAVGAGANNVNSITFSLTDAREAELKAKALSEASKIARAKADSIAQGLGVSITGVYRAGENSYYVTPNYRAYDSKATAGMAVPEAAPTPITPGDVEVSASVGVTYTIG
ncbi:MAG: SIMPL domain-containing protein [Candidatus Micrarchaeia archaeon]|jgi:hypothetical protein